MGRPYSFAYKHKANKVEVLKFKRKSFGETLINRGRSSCFGHPWCSLLLTPSRSGPLMHLYDLEVGYGGGGLQSWLTLGGDRTPAFRVESECNSDKLSRLLFTALIFLLPNILFSSFFPGLLPITGQLR